jgi:hypothetical protein
MDAMWMETCNEKTMSSFLLPCYHLLANAPLIYDYNFSHIGFEIISYDYHQLCSGLE